MSHVFKIKSSLNTNFVESFMGVDTLKVPDWDHFKSDFEDTYVFKTLFSVTDAEIINIINSYVDDKNIMSYSNVCALEQELYRIDLTVSKDIALSVNRVLEEIPLLLKSSADSAQVLYFSEL